MTIITIRIERDYAPLQTVDKKTLDTTLWLEYFCEGVAVSMSRIKNALLERIFNRRAKEKTGQIFLNERQRKIFGAFTNPERAGLLWTGRSRQASSFLHTEKISCFCG